MSADEILSIINLAAPSADPNEWVAVVLDAQIVQL
jgi:hypothetical protein